MNFNTQLLHDGVVRDACGATITPIFQSSAFEQESAEKLEQIFDNKAMGYCYTRVGNPTITSFENRITKLEGGLASIACASGMAAIMNSILAIVRSGDEIISSASLYGGTIDLFRDLEDFGIVTRYVRNNNWDEIEAAFNKRTRAVFAETIGNPCLDVTDVGKLADIAHAHNVPLILDNTTATMYLFKGLENGADIVVNSSSKYINGSSNSISGILTYGGKFKFDYDKYPGLKEYRKYGPMAYIAKLRNSLFRDTGAALAPMNAFLNLIGLETLGLRMQRQCDNAYELASWLEENYPDIIVNYPGLKKSLWNEIAKKQLHRGFGAIVTLRLGTKERAFEFIDSLKIPYIVSNIGDTKTLVIHPECGVCVKACRTEALSIKDGVVEIDTSKCNNCGRCVKSCPTEAWVGTPGYIVSFGGTFGNFVYKGEELLPIIKDKETLFRVTDAAISYFEENAKPSERFRKTLERLGVDGLKEKVLEAYKG